MRSTLTLQDFRILVTREKSQAQSFSREIALRGGIPIEVPLLKISCQYFKGDNPIWKRIETYEWLFFTSANGVHCFFKQLNEKSISFNKLTHSYIAAVGHKTENALKEYGFTADFIPTVYDADTLAREFFTRFPEIEGPFLLIRGNKSLELLPKVFRMKNIAFDAITTYETKPYIAMKNTLLSILKENNIDILTFASPSALDVFVDLGGLDYIRADVPVACIGTTTEKRAIELGLINTIVPNEFTIEGLIEIIEQHKSLIDNDLK